MNKEYKYLLFLIWISYLLLAAVLSFTRGFLLIKLSQETFSTCSNIEDSFCFDDKTDNANKCTLENKLSSLLKNINSSSEVCLPKTAKVILIIIDALKYEFTQYNDSIIEPMPYQNKLTIIEELLVAYPKNARLMEFIADPPTTTMQRLKALTTGSLPTFVDAGSNFAAAKISEDNFIHQLVKHGHTSIFMGDDTWSSLYPRSFIRSYPYPSFDVFDLDTVDKGVRKNLLPEISNKGWDLIIAHFLGVDHCGHRYGPLHSEMSRKLKEMNEVISEIVKEMDNETVLFVVGDHGMTITGDHGGDSEAEVKSALFAYSSSEFISSDLVQGQKSVKQIDIVPTISAILGVPVPFSNLGSIILDVLPSISSRLPYTDWQYSLLLLWSNVKQVTEYILNYSEGSNQFQEDKIETIRQKFTILSHRIQSISNEAAFQSFSKDAKAFIILVRRMCEEVWVQFDSQLMSRGLCLIVFLIFAIYILVHGLPSSRLAEVLNSSFVPNAYSAMLTTSCLCYIFSYFKSDISLDLTVFLTTSIVSYVLFAILIVQNWETIALNFHESTKQHTLVSRAVRYILFLSTCVLFSNSFVVEEGKILSFLLISIVFIAIYDVSSNLKSDKTPLKSIKFKLFISGIILAILIRVSNFYFRCRAEQSNCSVLDIKLLSIDKVTCIVALTSLALLSTLIRIWLRHCGNLVGFSPSVLISRYCPTVLVVFIGGFWVLKQMPRNAKTTWQADTLPLAIYIVAAFALFLYWLRPLCVYLLPKSKPSGPSIYGRSNLIPQLFNHLKISYGKINHLSNEDIPVVCGLGTVYSSVMINVGLLTCLPLALLHGVVLSPSLVLLFIICLLAASVFAVVRYETAKNLEDLFAVPSVSIFAWMVLSLYFFYGTGQQPTFPTLQWEAAFVGTNEGFFSTQNIYIRGLLVMINTFSSQIIVGFLLPVLLIAPFTLYAIFPSLGGNSKEKDLDRGELNLYEMNDNFIDGLFVATCRYILYHGVRMFASMLAATILCRHLMVWKIFAPKFLFDGFSLMVTLVFAILGFVLVLRINSQVSKLIVKITKES